MNIKHRTVCMYLALIPIVAGCVLTLSSLEQGRHYFERGRYGQAIQSLEKAAGEDGDIYYYTDTYTLLARSYAQSGQKDKALQVCRSAKQLLNLKLRDIASRRMDIRRRLNRGTDPSPKRLQDEDLVLAEEAWKLKEITDEVNDLAKGLSQER